VPSVRVKAVAVVVVVGIAAAVSSSAGAWLLVWGVIALGVAGLFVLQNAAPKPPPDGKDDRPDAVE
jgi:hypothetical protein